MKAVAFVYSINDQVVRKGCEMYYTVCTVIIFEHGLSEQGQVLNCMHDSENENV